MAREVIFAPGALADLQGFYDAIAEGAAPARALAYVERVRAYRRGLATFPERGTRRDDLRPGLRTIGHRRRVTVAFHVTAERVVIDRILYAGRDLEGSFRKGAGE